MFARCFAPLVCVAVLAPAVSLNASAKDAAGLVEAVRNGDGTLVHTLLRRGVDVNTAIGDGTTALHWAAYRDDLETADLLIRSGARVDSADDLGATPLWVASFGASAAIIARLLEAGADPNRGPATGATALMRAVRTGNSQVVALLMNAGADANAKEGSRGQTALMWAVTQHHQDIVQMLLDGGADVEARTNITSQLVITCCQENNIDPRDAHWVNHGGFTPLLFAAQLGDVDSARLLLTAGAQVDAPTPENATPLIVAAHSGQGSVAILLLENGADPNTSGPGYTALHAAILRDDLVLAKALLADGANPNDRLRNGSEARRSAKDFAFYRTWIGATPLWMAAGFHKPALIQLLATHGADAIVTTKDGTTPLMAAAKGESPQALYQNGYPVLPPGDEASTLETIKVLLDLGANVNLKNEAGDTALHRVASKHFNSAIQFLADHGAVVDVQDKQGRTPVECALHHCHVLTDTKGSFVAAAFDAVTNAGANSTADLLRKLSGK